MARGGIRAVCLLAIALAGGCAPVVIYQPPERPRELVGGLRPADLTQIGEENYERLARVQRYPPPRGCEVDPATGEWTNCAYRKPDGLSFAEEWAWNRVQSEPPKLCLAMSGGGLRSAAFNLGVLKGLHEAGILQKVDVASSVSGGGYALSWYVAQKFLNAGKKDDNALFAITGDDKNTGEYQRHLAEKASNFYPKARGVVPLAVAVFPGIPLNLLANGVFGLHTNTSFFYNSYTARVRELLHVTPQKYAEPVAGFQESGIGILKLRDFMHETRERRAERPPFFIFNTTALIDSAAQQSAGLLQNTVFEFTPLQYGSDAFGRYRYQADGQEFLAPQRQWDLDEIATLSGAAFDFNRMTPHPSSRQLATAGNVDLGRYIPNPRLKRSPTQVGWWIAPLAHLFGRPHYARDADGTHIYLSDGGHSENLGAFSLVRRLCEQIIIVDAEEDSGYTFGAYFILKQALENELGVQLKIDEIENLRKISCPNIGCDPGERLTKFPEDALAWKIVGAKPVMSGTISKLPYCAPTGPRGPRCEKGVIDVHYVKLAYVPPNETGRMSRLEQSLLDAYLATSECADSTCSNRSHAPFPQLPTSIQNMPPTHFAAYRNLGCRAVLAHLLKERPGLGRFDGDAAETCLR